MSGERGEERRDIVGRNGRNQMMFLNLRGDLSGRLSFP
jgi:hypothetical protein